MNIEAYKSLQYLIYSEIKKIGDKLVPGITEKEVCDLVIERLKCLGIDQYFHLPFTWFGDRSEFKNFKRPFSLFSMTNKLSLPHLGQDFLPTEKELEKDMPYIIDVAPIKEGIMIDMGMAFYPKSNQTFEALKGHLTNLRQKILTWIQEGLTIGETYLEVNQYLNQHRLQNCHELYPLGVLGHKIVPLPSNGFLNSNYLMRFNLTSYMALLNSKKNGSHDLIQFGVQKPFSEGLWAIEPHLGLEGMGLKFEELLLVKNGKVQWLDERIPHIRGY